MSPSEPPSLALSVVVLGGFVPWTVALAEQGWSVVGCATPDEALDQIATTQPDAVVWLAPQAPSLQRLGTWPAVTHLIAESAVLVVVPEVSDEMAVNLVRLGIEDVLVMPSFNAPVIEPQDLTTLMRALRVSVARKRLSLLQRRGGSIDVATGLPTRAQWLDHLSQLCALREREPAPMAVVVLRLAGQSTLHSDLAPEALALLQRKLAVRLRAALRASDVVGSVGPDTYAVLLSWMESASDAELVASKLLRALEQPVRVGTEHAVAAVATGIARYVTDGNDAATLLRVAMSRSGSAPETSGAMPLAGPAVRRQMAANDDSSAG